MLCSFNINAPWVSRAVSPLSNLIADSSVWILFASDLVSEAPIFFSGSAKPAHKTSSTQTWHAFDVQHVLSACFYGVWPTLAASYRSNYYYMLWIICQGSEALGHLHPSAELPDRIMMESTSARDVLQYFRVCMPPCAMTKRILSWVLCCTSFSLRALSISMSYNIAVA